MFEHAQKTRNRSKIVATSRINFHRSYSRIECPHFRNVFKITCRKTFQNTFQKQFPKQFSKHFSKHFLKQISKHISKSNFRNLQNNQRTTQDSQTSVFINKKLWNKYALFFFLHESCCTRIARDRSGHGWALSFVKSLFLVFTIWDVIHFSVLIVNHKQSINKNILGLFSGGYTSKNHDTWEENRQHKLWATKRVSKQLWK